LGTPGFLGSLTLDKHQQIEVREHYFTRSASGTLFSSFVAISPLSFRHSSSVKTTKHGVISFADGQGTDDEG
jgi:hypothetical protein